MDRVQHCPRCSGVLVKSLGDEVKIRGKVLIIKDDQCHVVCKNCNAEVPINMRVNQEELTKSLSPLPLYINKSRK